METNYGKRIKKRKNTSLREDQKTKGKNYEKINKLFKHEYIVILKDGEQSINFEATSKEFKKLFKTLKGIKVFKANNIIIPLSSILYWYIETEETKKMKEEN